MFVFLLFALIVSQCAAFLDIYMPGLPNRIIANVSLGLDRDVEANGHQCTGDTGIKKADTKDPLQMTYSPNRRVQSATIHDAELQRLQLAFAVVLGGHREGNYDYGGSGSLNGLASVWDTWVDKFFSVTSNTTSFIFFLDEKDFLRQNYTKSKERYMDSVFVDNLGMSPVDCVRIGHAKGGHGPDGNIKNTGHNVHHHRSHPLREIRSPPPGCTNELRLDQGYRVYYLDMASITGHNEQLPFIAFVSIWNFPRPQWANDQDEDHLEIHWRPFRLPKRFNTNYAYAKLTNWYSHHLLNVQLLDYFDYAGKIDNDVSFINKNFPETNLPLRMVKNEAMALSTQKEWYSDMPAVANGVKFCLENHLENETKQCKRDHTKPELSLHSAGYLDGTFWEKPEITFRSHFMIFWLGLYTSPECKLLSKHWNEFHPHGMWDYRWGDQQWWPRPIHIFTNTSINITIDKFTLIDSDNDKYVKHKEIPRAYTLKDCVYLNISTPVNRLQREVCYNNTVAQKYA